jgi:alanyl-tRNA synthetase
VEPTIVRYPSGRTADTARVLATVPLGEQVAVITDATPFHPLDHTWPDQPADRGTLAGAEVVDCLTGAFGPDGALYVGGDIPVRRGDPEFTWVVVHLLAGDPPPVGAEVDLQVDEEYRAALSAAHTACHLAALALNEATAGLWRKEPPRRDSLGNPDLDGLAIDRSTITPHRSVDRYRLGKSIRKKGLDTAALLADLDGIASHVNQRLEGWIAAGGAVVIDTGGDPSIAARRTWTCQLPDGTARYPCGGTHVTWLGELPATTHVVLTTTDSGFRSETVVG